MRQGNLHEKKITEIFYCYIDLRDLKWVLKCHYQIQLKFRGGKKDFNKDKRSKKRKCGSTDPWRSKIDQYVFASLPSVCVKTGYTEGSRQKLQSNSFYLFVSKSRVLICFIGFKLTGRIDKTKGMSIKM